MEEFLYTEGIQLTAAHSGGGCSDLTQRGVKISVKSSTLQLKDIT